MIITVDPDRSFHERVAAAVVGERWAQFALHVRDPAEAQAVVAAHATPAVVVIGPRVPVTSATALSQRLTGGPVPVYVLVVAEPSTEVLRSAMRAGARDVLPPTFSAEDLRAAVDRTSLTETGAQDRRVVTVAVFSAKGGVGTSTVASNLTVRLAQRTQAEALLLDLDVASADQAVIHAQTPQWTLQELTDGTINADPDSLRGVLVPVPRTRASILPGPRDPAMAETISGDAVTRLIGAAWSLAPVVVLDTSSSFDDRTLAAIDAADVVVVVSSLDVAALRALSVSLQTLRRIGVAESAVRVALVRADSRSGLRTSDVERTIGREVDVQLPSSRDVVRSLNEGVPLAVGSPRSDYVRAIDELVDRVLTDAPEHLRAAAAGPRSRTGWRRFLRRRGTRDARDGGAAPTTPAPEPVGLAAVEDRTRDERGRVVLEALPSPVDDEADGVDDGDADGRGWSARPARRR